jgi:chromosome segregation protein
LKLKRLIIQGFKSFKDRTIIHFDDGITGIVGPNGCGKSNIVDALFWVMGEMSAKHLRGSSMKDVIFSGSEKYRPATFAEATLVLENTDGKHIHIGNQVLSPTEIELTRKLYRNGESEYRINKTPCRLKDVQEVFMDTGAGAKSYSIIAQGEINKLVQAKPEDRRVMIEEVAGITKFKLRRRESVKKIEATDANLSRLKDLKSEIDKNLKALQKQAEKAERARTLREKIEKHELIVNSHKVYELLKINKEKREIFNSNLTLRESWVLKKQTLENDLEGERLKKAELSEVLEVLQSNFNKSSGELASFEERLKHIKKNKIEKENHLSRLMRDLENLEKDIEERALKRSTLEADLEKLQGEDLDQSLMEGLKEETEVLKEQLEALEDEQTQAKLKREEFQTRVQKLENEAIKNDSLLAEYARNLEDIALEREGLEGQYSSVSKEVTKEREEIQRLEKQVQELEAQLELSRLSFEENRKTFKEQEQAKNALDKELLSKESRLESLKEWQRSAGGATEGAKRYLETAEHSGAKILGGLVECEERFTKATQAALSELLGSILPGNLDLSYDNLKDLTLSFIRTRSNNNSLSAEGLERLRLALGVKEEELVSLSSIIRLPSEFSHLAKMFDASFVLLREESKDKLININSDLNFNLLVDLEGRIVVRQNNTFQSTTIFSINEKSTGVVERNNLIKELEAQVLALLQTKAELDSRVIELDAKLEGSRLDLDELSTKLNSVRADYLSKKAIYESKIAGFSHQEARLNLLRTRQEEISTKRLDVLEIEDRLKRELLQVKADFTRAQNDTEGDAEKISELRSIYQEKRETLLEKEVFAKSFESRLASYKNQLSDIDTTLNKYRQKVEESKELETTYRLEIAENSDMTIELEASTKELATILKDKEEEMRHMKDSFAELLLEMQEREDEVKDLNVRMNKIEKENMEIEVLLSKNISEEEQVTKNIFEKYQIDLRFALGRFLEYTDEEFKTLVDLSAMYFMETEEGRKEISRRPYEFIRRYGQDLKDSDVKLRSYKMEFSRLGEINWQAIEDFDRQKLRFDFLKNQEEELEKSLTDLKAAIFHIDQKSKKRFADAFEEVNVRFKKVFPIIFGGGTAELKITGDLDDPECGVEIIAQPPGKKMQNINLMSGGEKALTAVSLIFSIFLVKPSPFCLLDEVDAPLDDANVGRFNELLREMSSESQFILITHNKKTMELNDTLYGVTMQEAGISTAVSVQLH